MFKPLTLRTCVMTIVGLSLLACSGCGKKDANADAGSGSSASSATDKADAEASLAVRDELAKHWLKVPDGWLSEFPSKVLLGTGARAGPESYYRQMKDLTFTVSSEPLSDSDKLNGVEYRGTCDFHSAPVRVYGDPNAFGPPRWAEWHPSIDSMMAVKKNGKWQIDSTGWFISGTKPAADVFRKLK